MIYVALDLAPELRAAIAAAAPGAVHYGADEGEMPAAFGAAEIVFGNVPLAWLEAAPPRWVQLESVGFGEYAGALAAGLADRLTMTNLAGFFSKPVAESILAGILAHHRGIDRAVRLKAERTWQGEALRPHFAILAGARVVIFGHGAIGRRLAELLAPFEVSLTTFGRSWTPDLLDRALGEADIVVAIAPHTPQTAGAFDAARIGAMKPGALFLNFGRGSLVDEAALSEALHAGRLAAVLDVTAQEPLPPGHPFWDAPNLILTQHSAGGASDEVARKVAAFVDNLKRYTNGEPLQCVVDPIRGY